MRLDAPERLNAMSTQMVEEIVAGLNEAERSARALAVTGVGRAFCSGADLSGWQQTANEPAGAVRMRDFGEVLETHINPLMSRLRDLSIPWISLVRGAAAGVGCSLALAADMVVASETAYFLQAFARIGLVPDGGSSFMLTRAVGRVRASEMMLLGERVAAAQALEWGLVNRVVPDGQLDEVGMDLARRLAAGPTKSLALIRGLCWGALERSWDDTLVAERQAQRQVGDHDDPYEGIAAFNGKRPAAFTGT